MGTRAESVMVFFTQLLGTRKGRKRKLLIFHSTTFTTSRCGKFLNDVEVSHDSDWSH